MQCTNCEAPLKETSKFCTSCGQSVDPTQVNAAAQAPVQNNAETEESVVTIDTDELMQYASGYGNFLKETLTKPSSVFNMSETNWVFGLVSTIMLSLLYAWLVDYEFMSDFFFYLVVQAVTVGGLFLISKIFSTVEVSITEVVKNFGGLLTLQLILTLLVKLIGLDSGLGMIIAVVSMVYQLGFINYYILRAQRVSKVKFNPYYQLVAGNVLYMVIGVVVINLLQ